MVEPNLQYNIERVMPSKKRLNCIYKLKKKKKNQRKILQSHL